MEWLIYAGVTLAVLAFASYLVQRRRAARRAPTTDDIYPMW
jgi:hypothetical protein